MRLFLVGQVLLASALLYAQTPTVRGYDTAPVLIHKVDPIYSDEARAFRFEGRTLLEVVIDTSGMPTAIRVLSPIGLGLEQKAIECVQKWRFKPGSKNGSPVAVTVSIEVNFRFDRSEVSPAQFDKIEGTRTEYNLGVAAFSGREGTPDYGRALEAFRKTAREGYAPAQLALAKMYLDGLGMQRDPGLAADWCVKAAKQGLPEAEFMSGLMAANGDGMPRNLSSAANWYKKAAAQGHAKAQFNLALAYETGMGVRRDQGQALKLIRTSAEKGLAEAQYRLGVQYREGAGVPKDKVAALVWFTAAASQSFAPAESERKNLLMSLSAEEIARAEQMARDKASAK
jgi:TonB family protein